ncbi:putative S-layer protein [archaeon]|jgi:hypothetical protein|nr:putative S-layer protein [archaeon]MBT6182721.1 putative S-layer protein [archaeon]MBT6606167.1 putative S-layer protein [archaeon]MBT7251993.1 putative S-layer protein [archaeon]MBT7660941.1 putative S-layer protein [archaeon]
METKNTILSFAIFTVLLLSIGFIAATVENVTMSVTQDLPSEVVNGEDYDVIVFVENNNGSEIELKWLDDSTNDAKASWTILPTNGSTILTGANDSFTATLTINSVFTGSLDKILMAEVYDAGTLIGEIEVSFTANYEVTEETFCSAEEVGSLRIEDFNINNNGEGDDEEWEPLDEIEIEVEIENTHSTEDVRDVLVQIMILDSDGNDITNDFDIDDEEIDLGRIRDDDSEIATFVIDEIPADIEDGTYRIYIKAFSENHEDSECVSLSNDFDNGANIDNYHEVEISREEDEGVIVKSSDLEDIITTTCGAQVSLNFPVYNIGIDKEENVLVSIYNHDLNILESVSIGSIKEGKKKTATLIFEIPEKATKNNYKLSVVNYYLYDDDKDSEELNYLHYDANSEDDLDRNMDFTLQVIGCSALEPSVNAVLDSEALVGEELIITTTITNNGEEADYVLSLEGLSSWADVVSVTPQTFSLEEGESKEVTVVLLPKAGGSQTFDIVTLSMGEKYSQSVSVNIVETEEELSFFEELTSNSAYAIIGITAILILILLILIVRVSRRSTSAEF